MIQAFCARAANVIFRHASTGVGVWVKELREYASTVREWYARKVCGPYFG